MKCTYVEEAVIELIGFRWYVMLHPSRKLPGDLMLLTDERLPDSISLANSGARQEKLDNKTTYDRHGAQNAFMKYRTILSCFVNSCTYCHELFSDLQVI